jgi:hypothetical protein
MNIKFVEQLMDLHSRFDMLQQLLICVFIAKNTHGSTVYKMVVQPPYRIPTKVLDQIMGEILLHHMEEILSPSNSSWLVADLPL